MSSLLRVQASPALLPRALVSLGALFAIGWAALGYASGAARAGPGFAMELLALAVVGALTRRYGIPLPGNGFSSYVLGVVAYALLARGLAFATVLAPRAVLPGDLWLRRLPSRAAFGNAAHLAAGTFPAGLLYARRAVAAGIALARRFGRVQALMLRLGPWERMGVSRYDALTNAIALIAETGLPVGERSSARLDAGAGVAGDAVRLRRPLVARGTRGE